MIHARIQEFLSGGGRGGGSRSIWHIKKSSDVFFIYSFSPQFILQKSSGYFQGKLLFVNVPVGVEHFPGAGGGGGVQLFKGGSNCFCPIETHITCDFPGGPDRLPPPPLDLPM